jgi:hypothetical protein
MAVDVQKMRDALELLRRVDELLTEAGVDDVGMNTGSSFKMLYEDLEADLFRAESGDFN